MGKSLMSTRRKLPTKGSDRQEGSAAGLGQKRPGVNNVSSMKKKKQSFIDDNSANDLSTDWSGRLSSNSDSDEDNDLNQKGRITTNLTETSRTASEVESKVILMGHPILCCHAPVIRSFFIHCKMIISP
jgi:hypothetical protein